MEATKYTINKYGHRQALDRDGEGVCPDCGRCHINFGNGVICESCQDEDLTYAEQMYEDFKSLD
jgi:hypothetical protein